MAEAGYRQFCPLTKGAEIVATRWTPLVLRELMCGEMSFNDIHRGVPRMSRAALSERLRQLESDGITTVLMWALRRRVNRNLLPARRIVIRFDLSGVARCRTGVRLHWLVLERRHVDVCLKDPGYAVDGVVSGPISLLIDCYLGHLPWREAMQRGLQLEGHREVARELC